MFILDSNIKGETFRQQQLREFLEPRLRTVQFQTGIYGAQVNHDQARSAKQDFFSSVLDPNNVAVPRVRLYGGGRFNSMYGSMYDGGFNSMYGSMYDGRFNSMYGGGNPFGANP